MIQRLRWGPDSVAGAVRRQGLSVVTRVAAFNAAYPVAALERFVPRIRNLAVTGMGSHSAAGGRGDSLGSSAVWAEFAPTLS